MRETGQPESEQEGQEGQESHLSGISMKCTSYRDFRQLQLPCKHHHHQAYPPPVSMVAQKRAYGSLDSQLGKVCELSSNMRMRIIDTAAWQDAQSNFVSIKYQTIKSITLFFHRSRPIIASLNNFSCLQYFRIFARIRDIRNPSSICCTRSDFVGLQRNAMVTKDPTNVSRYEVTKDLNFIKRHGDETKGIRVENLIGFAQVPLGIAGPLQIDGHYQKGSIMAPMATVEAAVIATAGRRCKALQACGEVKAYAISEGMGRAPIFFLIYVNDAITFYKRLPSLEAQLRKDAEATSRFASLFRVTGHIMGSSVHVHFEYETGDAAGQNMTEFATMAACTKLLGSDLGKELKIVKINLEGNMKRTNVKHLQ